MLELNELKNVDTASRYTGGEVGEIIKKGNIVCKSAMALPLLYEMAMANMNFRQMYYNLNKKRECSLERCFAVMPDYEELLKRKNEELCTLETKTSLKNMDLIFTELSSSLVYTTFLHMLTLASIPIRSSDRTGDLPVIIAGGDAATYPKPMSKMIDVFIVGDMVRISEQIVDKYILCKKAGKTKSEFLQSLIRIEGVYIPSINKDEEKINMTHFKRLNEQTMPGFQINPQVSSPMDNVMELLTLGCKRNCNMCQHKYLYTGVEPKDIDHALNDIKRGIEATGNRRICLVSNCYADYEGLQEVVEKLKEIEKPKVQTITFMEVKLNSSNLWLLPYLKEQYKKTGETPTVIVGAATDELRSVLGINITDEEVLTIAKQVFRAGFNKIRLKYVLGIPKETYEDLNDILTLASKIIKVYTEEYGALTDKYIVELDLCGFIPLPHTPLQFASVNNYAKLQTKAKYLEEKNKNEFVKLTFDNFVQNEIATILTRGDSRVSEAICMAVDFGANFDYLPYSFNYDVWHLALSKAKVDVKAMLEEINVYGVLPWDNIVTLVSKEELAQKYLEIMKGTKNESSSDK